MPLLKERISSEAHQPPILTNHDLWLQLAVVQYNKTPGRLSRSQVIGLMKVYDPTTPQSVTALAERVQNLGFDPTYLWGKSYFKKGCI